MAGVRSQLSHFEIEEVFRSLQTLLSSSFNSNISYDSAEFLSRRLDVYERNISNLLARLIESYPLEQQLLTDMHTLQVFVRRQRERCEALSFRSILEELLFKGIRFDKSCKENIYISLVNVQAVRKIFC